MKKVNTVVEDIYKALEPLSNQQIVDIPEELLEELTNNLKECITHWATPQENSKQYIRMSNVGRPLRQLYFDLKEEKKKKDQSNPFLSIRFLYGHLLEEILIFLVKLSGHTVTDEQKEVVVDNIKGHIDCKIDGEVIDIKTASNFAFKKFKEGTLRDDDPFGYLAQLSGYEEAEKSSNGGFLAINKETGELTLYQPDELDKPNIRYEISKAKKAIDQDNPPEEMCYEPVPEGKAGNMKLPKPCVYCSHKHKCYSDLRIFKYSKGLTYFTKVVNEPRVEEVL